MFFLRIVFGYVENQTNLLYFKHLGLFVKMQLYVGPVF